MGIRAMPAASLFSRKIIVFISETTIVIVARKNAVISYVNLKKKSKKRQIFQTTLEGNFKY